MGANRNATKHIKNRFSTPKKGTGRREILKLMLRKEGFGTFDLDKTNLKLNKNSFSKIIEAARDEYGFIIKIIGKFTSTAGRFKIYKIIGRYHWSGKIRYFKFNE